MCVDPLLFSIQVVLRYGLPPTDCFWFSLCVLNYLCRHGVSLAQPRKLASSRFMVLIISHSASGFSGASFVAIVSPAVSIVFNQCVNLTHLLFLCH